MEYLETVSAVIPTRHRPQLVQRAVRSALAQTYNNLEVIVVVDGPDTETEQALAQVENERLRVIVLDHSVGGAQARNIGARSAQGTWIAFLDDDDEWLPEKTALQMERARASAFRHPIVCCQVFARNSRFDVVWPRIAPSEPLSEYLLARNRWSYGQGLLQTTTLLFPKELIASVSFRAELPRHQDWDWVLRAVKETGCGIEFISQPLAIWNQAEGRRSVSAAKNWRVSFDWAQSARDLMTDRAYSGFLATQVAPQAAQQRDWRAFPFLLRQMLVEGAPNMWDLALFFSMWTVPANIRTTVRKANR